MNKFIRRPISVFGFHKQIVVLLAFAFFVSASALAQQKRALTQSDFDSWRSIQGQIISRDGKFVAYAAVAQDGDGEIVARNIATGKEWRTSRGAQPTFVPAPAGAEGPPPVFGARLFITADSRFAVFQILPTKGDTDKAKKEKKKPEDMPKNALGIMDLTTGEVTRIERVKNFQVPEDGAGFLAYLLEPKKEERKPEGGSAAVSAPPAAPSANDKKKKEYGSDLVLRNLKDQTERSYADVLEYTLSKDAKHLLYAVSSKKEDTNGVYAVTTAGTDAAAALLTGKGKFSKLSWDDKQTQIAFVSDRDDASAAQPKFKLYHWTRNAATAAEIVSTASPNFRQGWVVSEKGNLTFSLDGAKLFLGISPAPEPEKDDDTPADEKVLADLWHYKDDYIQPMQKVRAEQEKNRSYRAIYHIKEKKFVQLADETMRDVNPTNDGRWALGQDDREYRILVGYSDDANSSDVYLINTTDGTRKLLFKKQRGGTSWSPNGKYALFYDGKNWNTVSIPDGKVTNLTANLGVNFYNEEHDSPSTPGSYGSVGWTADEKYVLLYDKYDIWQVAPDGSNAKTLTDSVGRKEKIQFRYVKLDPQERALDATKPMLLSAENDWTLDTGFYRDKINGTMPEKLVMAAKSFNNPSKAKDADVYLLSASTFTEFPDLLVTNPNFTEIKRVSDLGKQKEPFIWGTAELVRFKNTDGVPLTGMLVKPENFDANKKYPMVVYIYEKLSNGLHRFVNPAPGQNVNPTIYSSNGYVVFMPDIVYTIGHPGQSALKCVLPGIQAVVDKGFVNEDAIGIQGHSWGGYQIAYMITQTTRFKAAAAGAPVANMTSAYSGIRWGTGLPRQFQYEHTQSRIGANLWEAPMLYLENSPVFRANQVKTPLLMLHNDNDDAVPWYQGIEYFLALRRLGKEVYMFNYNGEPHGIRKRQNQKDYAMRLLQFFDFNLKGAAKPEWMERGIPYLQKEKEKEKYKAAPAAPAGDVKAKAQN